MKSVMICKTTQFRLANLDGQEPSLRMSKHLQDCTGCRVFKEKLAGLSSALRASADSAPAPVVPDVVSASTGRAGWLPRFAFVPVAAMAAGFLYWNLASEPESFSNEGTIVAVHSDARVTQPLQEEDATHEAAEVSSSLFSGQLGSIALLQSVTPLEEELDALRSDGARGLSRLLALGQRSGEGSE